MNKDILNSSIEAQHSNHGAVSYRTSTTSGYFVGPKVTTLDPLSYGHEKKGSAPPARATIYWKDSALEVGGSRKHLDSVSSKVGGFFSLCVSSIHPSTIELTTRGSPRTREWRWSTQAYTVAFNNNQWTAAPTHNPHAAAATLSPYKRHFFSSSEQPVLSLAPGLGAEEETFLILVMLYMETKRLEKNQATSDAAVGAGTT
ncbi:hypothetical protein DXG01_012635 [Tephrocybe rancida]|nr:hypothetical protein DXG01_012635 [Tephrocybe rancida]